MDIYASFLKLKNRDAEMLAPRNYAMTGDQGPGSTILRYLPLYHYLALFRTI